MGAGTPEKGQKSSLHDPDVLFDEKMLSVGAAALAYCAEEWLKENELLF